MGEDHTDRGHESARRDARLLLVSVAFVWLATGLLVLHPRYREIGEHYLAPLWLGPWIMWLTCAFEVGLALLVALAPPHRLLVALQAAMVTTFTLILAISQPMLLVHPMGVLSKNLPLLAALGTAFLLWREGWSVRARRLLRGGMALIWITEGLGPKVLVQQEVELAIARESPLVFLEPSLFLTLLGLAQIASGIAVLVLRGRMRTLILGAQFFALLALPWLTAWNTLEPWVHPFGPLTKNVPILAGTWLLFRGRDRS